MDRTTWAGWVSSPAWTRVRDAAATVTPLGRAAALVAVVLWVAGVRLGWVEFSVLATVVLALLGLAALTMIGRTRVAVVLTVEPLRVRVGGDVAGDVQVRNVARSPLLPVLLDVPVGAGAVPFQLPFLRPGGEHTELFVVPTDRRGVVPIGPVTTVRGDPLGLFRRTVTWTDPVEVFVHPRLVPLDSLGAGLLRDLEGVTTDTTSSSDLAFHALREYVPGDDLRHVHWLSSAKVGELMVRQYLDTRRTHVVAVVDTDPDAYAGEDEFETAVSVAASVLDRGLNDAFEVSLAGNRFDVRKADRRQMLDTCSRLELSGPGLLATASAAAAGAGDVSLALLVTGPRTGYGVLQRAAGLFPPEARRLVIRVDADAPASLGGTADLSLMTVNRAEDLAIILRGGS